MKNGTVFILGKFIPVKYREEGDNIICVANNGVEFETSKSSLVK